MNLIGLNLKYSNFNMSALWYEETFVLTLFKCNQI